MLGLENPIHLAFLLLIVLLLFGAKRLPEMGRSLGTGMRGFKDALSGPTEPEAEHQPEAELQAEHEPEAEREPVAALAAAREPAAALVSPREPVVALVATREQLEDAPIA
jgi:sec-independent protein translocase protein TatA